MFFYSKEYPDGSTHFSSSLTEGEIPDGATRYLGRSEWSEAQAAGLILVEDHAKRVSQGFQDKRTREASQVFLAMKPLVGAEVALIMARSVDPRFEAAV